METGALMARISMSAEAYATGIDAVHPVKGSEDGGVRLRLKTPESIDARQGTRLNPERKGHGGLWHGGGEAVPQSYQPNIESLFLFSVWYRTAYRLGASFGHGDA
jgi:hypothetical protein